MNHILDVKQWSRWWLGLVLLLVIVGCEAIQENYQPENPEQYHNKVRSTLSHTNYSNGSIVTTESANGWVVTYLVTYNFTTKFTPTSATPPSG